MTAEHAEGTLVSIQVGQPQTYSDGPGGKPWRSAIDKKPIAGPVNVGTLGVDGDTQVDQRHHGGEDKAVLAYSFDHYDCLLYTSPSPRDQRGSRMPSSA